MASEAKMEIPAAPNFPGLPESKRAEWRAVYAKALKAAAVNFPDDEVSQRQAAAREANRMLAVPEPANYAEARSLEDWQVVSREVHNGQLSIVTIDGRKFYFPVPRSAAKEEKPKE